MAKSCRRLLVSEPLRKPMTRYNGISQFVRLVVDALWTRQRSANEDHATRTLERWTRIIANDECSSDTLRILLDELDQSSEHETLHTIQSCWIICMNAGDEDTEELRLCQKTLLNYVDAMLLLTESENVYVREATWGCLGCCADRSFLEQKCEKLLRTESSCEVMLAFVCGHLRYGLPTSPTHPMIINVLHAIEANGLPHQVAEAYAIRTAHLIH